MVTTDVRKNYEAFLEKRGTLISMIDRQIALSTSLHIDTWVETLQRLEQRVSNDSFKVLIIGEFKRGKSTFINAMLGQDILPAYSTPCTAIINEVKWGQSPQALLHYLKHEDGSQQEPENIPVEAIEEYVVIPEEPDDNYTNPYEKVEILYPLELCRSGVEVIDSPGLNEHATRSQVTEGYLPVVDAIIFVFTCEALASQSEIRFIENNLKPLGHEDLFFVCNKFDQIRDKEKERVRKFAISKLTPLTNRGENGVFFISAFNALEGRLNKDEEKIEKSGVLVLERELEKFLTNDRGRLKILDPAKDLQEAIKIAKQTVPQRKAMLQTSREELEKRYQLAQEPLKLLQERRKQIGVRIAQFCEDVERLVFDKAYIFYTKLPDKIESWVKEYEAQTRIDLSKLDILKINESIKTPVKNIVNELASYLSDKIEEEFIQWQKEEIQSFVDSRLTVLKQDIDARASEFIRAVEELRSQLASGQDSSLTKNAVSSLERLLSAAGKSNVDNYQWTNAIFGFGSRRVVSALWGSAGLAGLFTLLGVFIPILLPLIVAAVAIAAATGEFRKAGERIEAKIKEETSGRFSTELRKSSKEQARYFAAELAGQLIKIRDVVDQGLAKEIQSIEDQVKSVLREKDQGQSSVDQKVRELAVISQQLSDLEGELDDLVNQLSLL